MIERDRRHDADAGVDDVGRVPAPPESYLDDTGIDRRVREGRERHRRQELEERHAIRMATVDDLGVRRDFVVHLGEAFRRQRCAVDTDALGDALQVRRRVASGAHPGFAQQRVDHPRGGGLAVRTGQVNRGICVLRVAEQPEQVDDAVEVRHHPGREAAVEFFLDAGQSRRAGLTG